MRFGAPSRIRSHVKIPLSKLGLLGALYFVQGMPLGFQTHTLVAYLRSQGVSMKALGLLSALFLPWLLKPFLAPIVERYGSARLGERKTWILPLQVGLALTCLAAAHFARQENFPVLLGLIFLMNLFAATQDIAVDGLAVDLLQKGDLGTGNAVQVVGFKLGSLATGGLLGSAFDSIGLQGIFLSMAGLAMTAFVVALLSHEPPRAPRSGNVRMGWRELFSRMWTALLLPGTGWLLLFIGTYKLGESLSDVAYKPFLVDSGFKVVQISWWSGTWGTVASLLGSLGGGWLATRTPLLRAVAITATLRVLPLVGRWLLALGVPGASEVIGVTLAEEFFGGALTTAMFAFMMSRVDRHIGGAHFTLFAEVELLGKLPAGPVVGILREDVGWSYAQVFLLGVGLSLAFLLLLVPLSRRQQAPIPPHPP
jgi:PAT family beta-lactamase induction signal transducer AmpG